MLGCLFCLFVLAASLQPFVKMTFGFLRSEKAELEVTVSEDEEHVANLKTGLE